MLYFPQESVKLMRKLSCYSGSWIMRDAPQWQGEGERDTCLGRLVFASLMVMQRTSDTY